MTSITIRRPDDFHLHLRAGALMQSVLPYSARVFQRGLIMPNTDPPVLTAEDALRYRGEITEIAPDFQPLMTMKILPVTTTAQIVEAKKAGVLAGKVYPEGVTTNSADGARNMVDLYPAFGIMEKMGMVLCLHGEAPNTFCLDRERAFVEHVLLDIAMKFRQLRIVLEHISTQEAVAAVRDLPNVAATITVHHLCLTLDDIVGGNLHPHHFCKPIAKRHEDRAALRRAARSGDPKFFLGTDSAPHVREKKECAEGCAGIFTAPVALPLLAQIFEEYGALGRLEAFTSEYGAKFYGLPLNEGKIELIKYPWTVPSNCAGVVPFKAGETLEWSLA